MSKNKKETQLNKSEQELASRLMARTGAEGNQPPAPEVEPTAPVVEITGKKQATVGDSAKYTADVAAQNATTVAWSVSGGKKTTNKDGTVSVTWDNVGRGSVCATAADSVNGLITEQTIHVQVKAVPVAPEGVISGQHEPNEKSTVEYLLTLTAQNEVTVDWSATGGAVIESGERQGQQYAKVTWGGAGAGRLTVDITDKINLLSGSDSFDVTIQEVEPPFDPNAPFDPTFGQNGEANVVTPPPPVVEESALEKSLFITLDQYIEAMKPGKWISDNDGKFQQVYLSRIIRTIFAEEPRECYKMAARFMEVFHKHRHGCFHERYVFRFMSGIPLNNNDRKTFERMITFFQMVDDKMTRLAHIDLSYVMEYCADQRIVDNFSNFFRDLDGL